MTFKGLIKYSLFLLLLILLGNGHYCNNNRPGTYRNAEPSTFANEATPYSVIVTADVIAKRHVVIKDKIRVRYMGGECEYKSAFAFTLIKFPEYIENLSCGHYISYTSAYSAYLFKLRGPPCLS